ncbi:MAG: hypothetical protein ACT4P4_00220 [Betaproteobacteria bacterium]
MTKLALPLSLAAIAVAAVGCARHDRVVTVPQPVIVQQPAPAVVTAPTPPAVVTQQAVPMAPLVTAPAAQLRPGVGRIESMSATPTVSAATGASVPSRYQRLGLRMNDGTLQIMDTDAPGLAIGERVEITSDGYIRRPAP